MKKSHKQIVVLAAIILAGYFAYNKYHAKKA